MRLALFFFLGAILSTQAAAAAEQKLLPEAKPLPIALSDDFQFRKTKIFLLTDPPKRAKKVISSSTNPGISEASITFERSYRLFGAVTGVEQRARYGHYFDFFWRAKRPANVTVRLEYRQEKLRSYVQAREVSYPNARGRRKTEFAIIGDDYFNDGRVTAWRCLLIENGQIVAENRSYLWE